MKNEITVYFRSESVKAVEEREEMAEMINTSSSVPNSEIEKAIAKFNKNRTEESWSELMEILLLWFNTGGKVLAPAEASFIDEKQSSKNNNYIPLITAVSEENELFQECCTSVDTAKTENYSDFVCIPFEDIMKQRLAGFYESVVLNYSSDSLYLELDRDRIESLMGMKYDPAVSEVMYCSFLHGLYKKDDSEETDNTYPSIAIFPIENTYDAKWKIAVTYTLVENNTFMNTMWSFGSFNQEEKLFEAGSDVKLELMYRKDAMGKIGLKMSDAAVTDELKNFTGTYRKVANWKDVLKHLSKGRGGMSTLDKWIAL